MADHAGSGADQSPAAAKEEERLRRRLSSADEVTFTLPQPKSLDENDIEVVAVTFTVPASALLEKMTVSTTARRIRQDPFFADNDDGADAFQDGGPPEGDLPA